MQELKEQLKNSLAKARRIALLGVGSDLRADDNAGMLVSISLECMNSDKFKVFLGHTAPENLTGEIRKFQPTHVIIVDTAEMGKRPGEISFITPENSGGISFSTHKLPVKMMVDYLKKEIECQIVIIGIQPKSLEFGEPVSREVKNSIERLIGILKEIIGDNL